MEGFHESDRQVLAPDFCEPLNEFSPMGQADWRACDVHDGALVKAEQNRQDHQYVRT